VSWESLFIPRPLPCHVRTPSECADVAAVGEPEIENQAESTRLAHAVPLLRLVDGLSLLAHAHHGRGHPCRAPPGKEGTCRSMEPPPSAPRTCEAHGLRYDASPVDGCVLCRRRPTTQSVRGRTRPGFVLTAIAVLLISVAALGVVFRLFLPRRSSSVSATAHSAVPLRTTNSSRRSGAYYVPTLTLAARSAPLPLLVFLHGTGGNGDTGIQAFRPLADERGFAILAPESRVAPDGEINWEVGDHPGDVTDDRRHVMACFAELLSVLSNQGLTLDPRHVLVAGHSGGASSAPYLATNEEPFNAFAVLHGGAFPGGFGRRRVRGWFSTGNADPIRPPEMVTRAYEAARVPAVPFEMHVFAGGHEMGQEERRALVSWWLGM
jgi:poly(3-hydroxybutyrate) depolymerase